MSYKLKENIIILEVIKYNETVSFLKLTNIK